MTKAMTTPSRRELIGVLRERYAQCSRLEKRRILDEFTLITGCHRKSAIRILNGVAELAPQTRKAARPRVYDDAVHQALIVMWEDSDRVCGKRLKALMPILLPALELHGHLQLDPRVHDKLMSMSAATIDRRLRETRLGSSHRHAMNKPNAVQRSVRSAPLRTGLILCRATWRWISSSIPVKDWLEATCRVPDDQMSYRSYPLLAARELLQQFIREQVHGHQAA